jgi:hypothetical protein
MRRLFRLFIIFITLTLLSELFVRAVLTLPTASMPDNELGWVYTPNSTIFHTSEGRAINTLNSMGFNDDDPDINSEKTHILVLGDSLTQALQVPQAENFTSIAEAMAPCLDFYNAGRSGLSPIYYPTVLTRVTKSVTSELVVVVVTASDVSDIKKSNYKIITDKSGKHIIDLYFKAEPMTSLRIKLDPFLRGSALASYLMNRVKALLINNNISGTTTDKGGAEISDADEKLIHEILIYLFESMNSKTPIAILYIPTMEYGANRVASATKFSDEFEHLINDSTRVVGIPFLSTKAYMKASYHENGQPGNGFSNNNILGGHLNKLGHHATALALLELVADAGQQCSPMNKLYKN